MNLPYVSTGIVVYLLSIFLLDNLILLFGLNLLFSQVLFCNKCFWILIFVFQKVRVLNFIKITLSYLLLNIFNYSFFLSKLSKSKNIIGDVKDIHLQHVKNIYENSYLFSVNNPTLEGYPQLVAYFQASLNKISLFTHEFENISASINVLYFLSIYLFLSWDSVDILKFFCLVCLLLLFITVNGLSCYS